VEEGRPNGHVFRDLNERSEAWQTSCVHFGWFHMERLYWTVVQLEEAKRLVKQGDVAHLRLALILLDNAVEVMMHRVIEGKLQYANMYARMVENFPEGPLDPEGEKIRRDLSLEVVPLKQQKQIRRIFRREDFIPQQGS